MAGSESGREGVLGGALGSSPRSEPSTASPMTDAHRITGIFFSNKSDHIVRRPNRFRMITLGAFCI